MQILHTNFEMVASSKIKAAFPPGSSLSGPSKRELAPGCCFHSPKWLKNLSLCTMFLFMLPCTSGFTGALPIFEPYPKDCIKAWMGTGLPGDSYLDQTSKCCNPLDAQPPPRRARMSNCSSLRPKLPRFQVSCEFMSQPQTFKMFCQRILQEVLLSCSKPRVDKNLAT